MTTVAGEARPPLYILDSKAKNEENYKIDPRMCVGLPVVTRKCGLDKLTKFHSFMAVWKKGSIDTGLWEQFIDKCILPCYLKMSQTVVQCPITKKMLSGPLILSLR